MKSRMKNFYNRCVWAVLIVLLITGTLNAQSFDNMNQIETTDPVDFNLEPAIYEISLNVFVEEGTDISSLYTYILEPWTTFRWDLSEVEKGDWVTMTQEFRMSEELTSSKFRLHVPDFSGNGSFFVDDIEIGKKGDILNVEESVVLDIYPNPTSDSIHLGQLPAPSTVRLTHSNGQLAREWKEIVGQTTLFVGDLKSGVYILHLVTQDGVVIRKIIIE